MNSVYEMRAVAAEAAADAAIENIRKQRDLEMELQHIERQWLFALKQIVNDKLELQKEFYKIAKVKVHRNYFQQDIRKGKLHNYTDHVWNIMQQEKYIKTHDNFNFTVDPLAKNVVPEPMIMAGDQKEGREAITSTSLDKKKAKHIRGLSELEVKVRRFKVPRYKKKKASKPPQGLPPLPDKIKRLKRQAKIQEQLAAIEENQESESEDEEGQVVKPTSISITHHHHESEQEKLDRTSVFTIPGDQIPFARAFIPLSPLPPSPEPSFIEEDGHQLDVPRSASQITTRLLSPRLPRNSSDRLKSPRLRSPRPKSPRTPVETTPPRSPSPSIPEKEKSADPFATSEQIKPSTPAESTRLPDIVLESSNKQKTKSKPKKSKGGRKSKNKLGLRLNTDIGDFDHITTVVETLPKTPPETDSSRLPEISIEKDKPSVSEHGFIFPKVEITDDDKTPTDSCTDNKIVLPPINNTNASDSNSSVNLNTLNNSSTWRKKKKSRKLSTVLEE